jgi:DNA-binding transcriptional MocR family regulator
MIYVVPNFQNPSGITLSLERRQQLIKLAVEHQVPIIDDNPYGELRYSGKAVPSLRGIGGDAVIQLGTFSKLVSPGLRVGWIVAPTAAMKIIERVKQATDLHSTTFSQYIILEYLNRGLLDAHVEKIKAEYSIRRDLMLRAMQEHFPACVKWTRPDGGLFLWVKLPEGISAAKVFDDAIKEGVAFVPGKSFHPDGSGENTLRMNFANATHEMILEGIKRLAKVLKKYCP